MRKYYLYAVFFVLLGGGLSWSLLFSEAPASVESLNLERSVIIESWEEELTSRRPVRLKAKSMQGKFYIFEAWFPGYKNVKSIIEAGATLDLWLRGRTVFQVEAENGFKVSFNEAITAYKKDNKLTALGVLVICFLGFIWAARKIKKNKKWPEH